MAYSKMQETTSARKFITCKTLATMWPHKHGRTLTITQTIPVQGNSLHIPCFRNKYTTFILYSLKVDLCCLRSFDEIFQRIDFMEELDAMPLGENAFRGVRTGSLLLDPPKFRRSYRNAFCQLLASPTGCGSQYCRERRTTVTNRGDGNKTN